MLTLIAFVIAIHLVILGFIWREHKRSYYKLEELVENRIGPVRGFLDGVGNYALTSSGLIPQLNKIFNKYGDQLSSEELALMRRSRACYYIVGLWGILVIVGIFSAMVFMGAIVR